MSLLQTNNLSAFYGDFQALFDINVTVAQGETVAIIGANGAGKTTFLRAVAGALPTAPDMVTFDGQPIGHMTPHEVVRLGIAMVPEGRRLFPSLSVEENLLLGGARIEGRQRDARLRGQPLDRLDEGQPLALLQEGDDVAGLARREIEELAFVVVDVERRRLRLRGRTAGGRQARRSVR